MGLWSKEQLRAFIKENNLVTAQDAQNALKDLFAETLQEMRIIQGNQVFGDSQALKFHLRFRARHDLLPDSETISSIESISPCPAWEITSSLPVNQAWLYGFSVSESLYLGGTDMT